jgi:hypothetical protein
MAAVKIRSHSPFEFRIDYLSFSISLLDTKEFPSFWTQWAPKTAMAMAIATAMDKVSLFSFASS